MAAVASHKVSLDTRARYARDRVQQQLLYFFGRAIPDLDWSGDAEYDMQQLADAIIEAAALATLKKLQTSNPAE